MNCPLCKDESVSLLEKINKDQLTEAYRKITAENFSYLINQDIDFCECENCSLRFFNPPITGDENFYNALQKFDWYYMDDKKEYHYAKRYISEYDKVLDVGSGKGAFAKHLAIKNYIGLDFSKEAKKMAKQNGIVIENEYIEDYASAHPESFDVVASFQVLEHVADPKGFLEGKINALKKGGRLIVAVPSEDSFLRYATNAVLNMPPHHVTRWSDKTFRYIAETYNLKLEEVIHEEVQNVHKQWYLNTLISSVFFKQSLMNMTLSYKLINKIASLIAKSLCKHIKKEMLPNGLSVVAVFTKK